MYVNNETFRSTDLKLLLEDSRGDYKKPLKNKKTSNCED